MAHPVTDSNAVRSAIEQFAVRFDPHLASLFADGHAGRSRLGEAMRYSLLAGGKRLRPYLVVECGKVCGGTEADALPAAVAIECVHTFSLVHDDLPAMDDDDLRRGRPTCHKVYGDGPATLVGDALLTLAFELLTGEGIEPRVSKAWVRELADAVGWNGMIAGQADDIAIASGEISATGRETVHNIHALKTARLLEASCRLGAIAAGADDKRLEAVARFGHHLGLAFQITDDLLDVTSTAGAMGKDVAKDQAAGKLTYPAVVGVEGSRTAAAEVVQIALAALEVFGPDADELRGVAHFVVERDH